jgi:hypothetical protein
VVFCTDTFTKITKPAEELAPEEQLYNGEIVNF